MRSWKTAVIWVLTSLGTAATTHAEPATTRGLETGTINRQAPLNENVAPVDTKTSAPEVPAHAIAQRFTRTPLADALEHELSSKPSKLDEQQLKEFDALISFYAGRDFAPVWMSGTGALAKAHILTGEIKNAGAWGLNAKSFSLPDLSPSANSNQSPKSRAKTEIKLSLTALKYARYARGGRIMHPAEMLNSNLDRKPKLINPDTILQGLAAHPNIDAFLQGLHPRHPQFENLRQAYLARRANKKIRANKKKTGDTEAEITPKQQDALRKRLGLRAYLPTPEDANTARSTSTVKDALRIFQTRHKIEPADGNLTAQTIRALNKRPKVSTKRLLANMEQWRWMWEDMGDVHVFANVPEFMLHVVKNGDIIHSERIVAGQISKQSSIFTRTLKHIVLRPMWRVPESIKVRELWPNLKGSGSMFRKFGLRLETKDGKRLDYRKINWSKHDIRNYEVIQPPGRKSVMGVVKFSFPSQHTIFMHDTPDKYMFKQRQRTFSHGCLRVRNPMELARILLFEDKGWSAEHVDRLTKSGPENNAIKIDGRIPIHLTYFTAWAKPDGTVRTFRDVYGHEKRISLALRGRWKKINKGRNHLAAVQPIKPRRKRASTKRKRNKTPNDLIRAAFGGGF